LVEVPAGGGVIGNSGADNTHQRAVLATFRRFDAAAMPAAGVVVVLGVVKEGALSRNTATTPACRHAGHLTASLVGYFLMVAPVLIAGSPGSGFGGPEGLIVVWGQ
jgi:hypothetical protein